MTAICNIPECDNEIAPGSKLKACATCRASMSSWKKRGVRAILDRRARLKKYDSRMEILVDERTGAKVVVLAQRRRKQA